MTQRAQYFLFRKDMAITMKSNKNSSEKKTDVNDGRITTIGKFLRKTSLDEMPQFINVLLGEMTVWVQDHICFWLMIFTNRKSGDTAFEVW